jgi:hypothetical protein
MFGVGRLAVGLVLGGAVRELGVRGRRLGAGRPWLTLA